MQATLPPMPLKWQLRRDGWVRYDAVHSRGVRVDYPLEEALVFDVEVCIQDGNKYPTLAVAASSKAWYSWASPALVKDTVTADLIPMGPVARLVVGHNVSYDRARVLEEYGRRRTGCAYLDTMSMHISLNGMTSGQRIMWRMHRKDSMGQQPDWVAMTAMNSLKDLARLYCGEELSKEDRNVFVSGSLDDVRADAQAMFAYCARDVEVTHRVYGELASRWFKAFGDITFAGMLEMTSAYLPVTPAWNEFIRTTDTLYHRRLGEIQKAMGRLAMQALDDVTSGRVDSAQDPWLVQLDWTLPKGRLRNKDAAHLQDKPRWYRDAYKDGALAITTRSRTAPCLLRLRWLGHPVVFDDEAHSWGYRDPATGGFVKLPHADGDDKSVGSPLAKGFLKDIDAGTLTSEYAEARIALQIAAECSYWVSTQERVKQQLVHQDPVHSWPAIVPLMVSAGTVTRRAVESTWLTASNTKRDRLGSELKAQVQAPPGYKFVGADVDSQELWIAAVIGGYSGRLHCTRARLSTSGVACAAGDAAFAGLHGSTAMGWMALRGTKGQGTDVHSRTAALVGIDRDTAKIFNYGRIYGAGIKFAEKLLLQHNRGMSADEAHAKATHLYENTKGSRWYTIPLKVAEAIIRDGKCKWGLHKEDEDVWWCVRLGVAQRWAYGGVRVGGDGI